MSTSSTSLLKGRLLERFPQRTADINLAEEVVRKHFHDNDQRVEELFNTLFKGSYWKEFDTHREQGGGSYLDGYIVSLAKTKEERMWMPESHRFSGEIALARP